MGIKYLNKFLLNTCNIQSQESIRSGVTLAEFSGKTLVVDASIYIYKFLEERALIENMYLFVSIMRHHNIIPVFVFDGKSPPEKKDLLYERRMKKKEAEKCYMELKSSNEPISKDIEQKMESLRRQFIRMTDDNIRATKELLSAYGIQYYEAMGEADQLCAQLVLQDRAWACVSDDMDMFVYGCKRVIRNISLLYQTCMLYNMDNILVDLNMTMVEFRQIMVISGTDYNMNDSTSLNETMNWFYEYKKQISKGNVCNKDFYHWLYKNTKYITNMELLEKIYKMFVLDDLPSEFANNICVMEKNEDALNILLEKEGFLK